MIKKLLKKFFPYLVKLKRSFEEITLIFNMELENIYKERAAVHKNPFVLYGETGFSQSDEDGLTKEIIKRLGIVNKTVLQQLSSMCVKEASVQRLPQSNHFLAKIVCLMQTSLQPQDFVKSLLFDLEASTSMRMVYTQALQRTVQEVFGALVVRRS